MSFRIIDLDNQVRIIAGNHHLEVLNRGNIEFQLVLLRVYFQIMTHGKILVIGAIGGKGVDPRMKIGIVNLPEGLFVNVFCFPVAKLENIGIVTGPAAFGQVLCSH